MSHDLSSPIELICGNAHPELGSRLASELRIPLTAVDITSFADGETRVHIPADLSAATVCILQPTCTPVNENLLTLALLVDAAKAAGAARIIGVVPYFGYARQEQRNRIGEPRSAQVAAKLLGCVGLDQLVVFDLHAPALESAFPFPTTMLGAEELFMDRIRNWQLKRPVVVSPDAGGLKRVQRFAMHLDAGVAVITKRRLSADFTISSGVLGDVRDRTCLVIDDMASTGRTLTGAAEALTQAGAADIHAVFTHAVMASGALERLIGSAFIHLLTSDSVPATKHTKLEVITVAPLLARTLRRLCGPLALQ